MIFHIYILNTRNREQHNEYDLDKDDVEDGDDYSDDDGDVDGCNAVYDNSVDGGDIDDYNDDNGDDYNCSLIPPSSTINTNTICQSKVHP